MFSDKRVKISELKPKEDTFNEDNCFYRTNAVFTGDLKTMTRKQAMQKIVDLGGFVKNNVSSNTDFLIVGEQDKFLVGNSGISSKHEKALELIENGKKIKILNEDKFCELIAVKKD